MYYYRPTGTPAVSAIRLSYIQTCVVLFQLSAVTMLHLSMKMHAVMTQCLITGSSIIDLSIIIGYLLQP